MSKFGEKSVKGEFHEGKAWYKAELLEGGVLKQKLEKFEKPEKAEKPEKDEKLEKDEKHEKPEKPEKDKSDKEMKEGDKPRVKEVKAEIEKPPASETLDPGGPVRIDRDSLRSHADALEATARQLRHFIEQSERPDLGRGALRNEDDA